ncbi:MAG: protein tyrosine phosphatase [Spirochaetota bacterium]
MAGQQRVLFVCTANQQRSPTAERLYEDDPRFEVRSAGTDALFGRKVTPEDLEWADLVVVMEDRHERRIRSEFPRAAEKTRLVVLDIPDVYQFMDQRLQREIRERFEAVVG